MTVLQVAQKAALKIGIEPPQVLFSSQEREVQELRQLIADMGREIAQARAWQLFEVQANYAGNGVTTDYALPSDYDRIPEGLQVWSTAFRAPLRLVQNRDEWLRSQLWNDQLLYNDCMISGGQMLFRPALPTGVSARHFYQTTKIWKDGGGSAKSTLTAADDSFRLDEDLLRLRVIWQWKADKRLDSEADEALYEEKKNRLMAADKGSALIVIGPRRIPAGVTIAYPLAIVP